MHNYPSDISREEFEIIKEELEGAKKKKQNHAKQICTMYSVQCYMW